MVDWSLITIDSYATDLRCTACRLSSRPYSPDQWSCIHQCVCLRYGV